MGNKLFATALVATVSLLGVSTVTFASSSLPSQGTVAFTPSNGVTPPYNPNHPNHPVGPVDPKQQEPGTAGRFRWILHRILILERIRFKMRMQVMQRRRKR